MGFELEFIRRLLGEWRGNEMQWNLPRRMGSETGKRGMEKEIAYFLVGPSTSFEIIFSQKALMATIGQSSVLHALLSSVIDSGIFFGISFVNSFVEARIFYSYLFMYLI